MQNKHSRVKRFPINLLGRDFIVGDIHGSYDAVLTAMKRVSFIPQHDRLFCVGDLVDRGEQSARVLKFMQQPYIFSVRGNHEENLLQLYKEGDPDADILSYMVRANGLGWWLKTSSDLKQAILQQFRTLPNVIEIETARGMVGIVHGDIPKGMKWPEFVAKIEAGDHGVISVSLEGRRRIDDNDQSGVEGIDRIFVGHSIQRNGAARYGNVYAVDTGAVLNEISDKEGFALTLANIACGTMVFTNPADGALPKINIKPDAVTNAAFGNYVVKT
jgi:serine/threonine protein phosphatase 1